jgi:hypothetical protein
MWAAAEARKKRGRHYSIFTINVRRGRSPKPISC